MDINQLRKYSDENANSFYAKHLEKEKKWLAEIQERALLRKNNPNLRHEASDEQIKLYNQNCDDLENEQIDNM